MSAPWLWVIGIGDDGLAGLSAASLGLLDQAEAIAGGHRHLKMLADGDRRPQILWTSPLRAAIDQLLTWRGRPVAVLASGDPMCYGIGVTLRDQLLHAGLDPQTEMAIHPAPSAFSLACSRLGWAWNEVETLSCCGRNPQLLSVLLYPAAKILLLSADEQTPSQIATILHQQGAGDSIVRILEHLGSSQERIYHWQATDPPSGAFAERSRMEIAKLHTIAIECPPHLPSYSRLPGLPDQAYLHDGQLTKQQVRACTLSALAPRPGELLWDVGAGNGSIAIEWLRSHPRNQAIAIEHHPQRLLNIAGNATQLGVPNLEIQAGKAPLVLASLRPPDTVFIGGGLTVPEVFETCWRSLKPGGRLVTNGVTVETEQRILALQQIHGGSLTRIAIQQAEPIGKFLGWKALAPITQWSVVKA
jgi:precorrin-6B C5,15-methyltransferase / cobalt-precorrin-6B C5,C15-methyltransferase